MEMNDNKKLALLIDSDNVAAKYAQFILTEASKYGELIIKRVYGDWEKNNMGWRIPAMNNSILAVQQNAYIAGKNATDFSMIIDAMDIMYTGNVDGFVLVTSDSDFTRLAVRLREAGKLVVGIGEVKTPIAFTSSCHHFSYLNQVCENLGDYDAAKLRKAVLDYVRENDDGKLDLMKINAYLTSCFGSVDYAALGFNRLSMFIDSIPELRRISNYVTFRKKQGGAKPALRTANALSEQDIVNTIIEYLKRKPERHDNICRVTEYLTKVYGKIDFSQFGSRRFAKFVDKQSRLKRVHEDLYPADSYKAPEKVPAPAAEPAKPAPKAEAERAPVKTEPAKPAAKQKPAPEPKAVIRITQQLFEMEVRKYAEDNMPGGGNLGQLNNMLLEKYGKNYVSDMEFADFAAAVASVAGVKAAKNVVKVVKTKEKPAPKKPAEEVKLSFDSVKRDVYAFIESSDNAASTSALGTMLTEKYGRGYLKKLGFNSLKKLIAGISVVTLRNDVLSMTDEFIRRTEEIEQFVYDFARGEGKHTIKSLSTQLKKKFSGFDFGEYGYSRFSDFVNAVDGVRAVGNYVEAV